MTLYKETPVSAAIQGFGNVRLASHESDFSIAQGEALDSGRGGVASLENVRLANS